LFKNIKKTFLVKMFVTKFEKIFLKLIWNLMIYFFLQKAINYKKNVPYLKLLLSIVKRNLVISFCYDFFNEK